MEYTKLLFTVVLLVSAMIVSAQENDTQEISLGGDSIAYTKEMCECCSVSSATMESVEVECDSIISTLNAEVVRLRDNEIKLKQENYTMEQVIASQQCEINRLKERLIFADSIVARVANDCLRKKYDKKRVDEAIVNFSRMYSIELQHTFSPLKDLLHRYGVYTKELVELLTTIGQDETLANPFDGHEKVLTYIDKIKSTRYYKDAYNKSWTIPYLNTVINEAIKRLEMYNPKENQTIKLLDLLE